MRLSTLLSLASVGSLFTTAHRDWRALGTEPLLRPLQLLRHRSEPLAPCSSARVANGLVSLGDAVRELPAPHHLGPCACCLCREARPIWTVDAIGERTCEVYLVREDGYRCPALEVERISSGADIRLTA